MNQVETYASLDMGWKLAIAEAWKSFVDGKMAQSGIGIPETFDFISMKGSYDNTDS
jgi:hypothetical protein